MVNFGYDGNVAGYVELPFGIPDQQGPPASGRRRDPFLKEKRANLVSSPSLLMLRSRKIS